MTYAEPLTAMMPRVAAELLGAPTRAKDGVLRYGSRGSLEVNTVEGWFAD